MATHDSLASTPTGDRLAQELSSISTKNSLSVDAAGPREITRAPAPLATRPAAHPQAGWLSLARGAGLASVAIGAIALSGWILDIGVLKSLVPGLARDEGQYGVRPRLGGRCSGLRATKSIAPGSLGAGSATCSRGASRSDGSLTLAEYASGSSLGIDQLLFHEPAGAVRTLVPGRMAPASALCFVLIGAALMLKERARRRGRLVQLLAAAAALTALASGLAYLYGAPDDYGLGRNTQMALHSIAGFLVLSAGILCLQPERGVVGLLRRKDAGGMVARRLLPAALLLPMAVGLEAGRRACRAWEPRFGSVLVAVSDIVLFSALIAWVARSLSQADGVRGRVEATLRESERRFRTLFEQSPAIKLLIDPTNGDIVDANAAAVGFYGYPAETLRQMQIGAISAQPVVDIQAEMQRASRGGRAHLFDHRLASGELRQVEVYSGPVEIDGRTLLESVVQDVSEQKRAQKALRVSEERFRRLAENLPDPIYRYRFNPEPALEFVSRAITEVLGHPPEDFYRDPKLIWRLIDPESRPLLAELAAAPAEGPALIKRRHPDGRNLIWTETHSVLTRDGRGELVAVQGILRDVTAQRQAEEERALLQAEFLKAQRMEAVGRLAGGVAHNFRNFLTAIVGYSELASTNLPEGSAARADIEEVKQAAERASEVTNGLLTFSRREMGEAQPLDLNVLVLELQSLLRQLIGEEVELEDGTRACSRARRGLTAARSSR